MNNPMEDTKASLERLKELTDKLVQSGAATQEEINILTNVMYNASLTYALEGLLLFHPDKLGFRRKVEMLVNEGMVELNNEEMKMLESFIEGQIQYRMKAMEEDGEDSDTSQNIQN